ncbi:nucleotidyltransferase family protein [Desulfopila inferna]|uniref:nucleotidyltransferase family protein n=1 Tax=Desulfopila inferna TaxID=468528 RepID=UPI0019661B8E|nr:nucleotidyltransferase family protein [Desulfopila inferna]MBM9603763.1 nucleotidyltransferase family protein [Desulfopila inferna]
MGRIKQLLPLRNEPALTFCLNRILSAGIIDIIVVLGHHREKIVPLLADMPVAVAVNRDPESQMSDSLQAGLDLLPHGVSGIMVGLADHPLVLSSSYRLLSRQHERYPHHILIPTYGGRGGHPTLFPAAHLSRGAHVKPMNRIIAECPSSVLRLPIDDPGVSTDMDCFRDYQHLASLAEKEKE